MPKKRREVYTKYLQASDFIEQQIGIDNANRHLPARVTLLAYSLIDQINYDIVCDQLLQFHLYDVFIDLEMLCSQNDKFVTREKLVTQMFISAVKQDYDSIALHMSVHFASVLLRSTGLIVPIILI